jgi:hypothetical protein
VASGELRVVEIRGVVLPTWLAVLLGAMAFCGALSLVVVLQLYRGDVQRLEREIRVLEVHAAAIEQIMVENGQARPSDFPSWEGRSVPEPREKRNARPEPSQRDH